MVTDQRKATEDERSAERKAGKEKRKARGKAEESMKATNRGPAEKKAAEALKDKMGLARKAQRADYQKTQARVSTRSERRRKQIQAELDARIVE